MAMTPPGSAAGPAASSDRAAGVAALPGAIPFATVREAAAAQGLSALAVLSPPPDRLDPAGLEQMIADGLGDLGWIAESRELRLHPTALWPGTRSLLVAAWDYQTEAGDGALRRARYAAGKEYHVRLRLALQRTGETLAPDARHRAVVDSAPLNERTLAQRAGLGWIGRNALVIAPDAGSFRFLGVLLTTATLAPHHAGHGADRCGSCTACETRCPTAALTGRRCLTERCISYLTIEHQGVIPRALAERFQGWWFGCDLCQEVCPWNRFAQGPADPRLAGSEDDARLLAVTAADFDQVFAGRAIRRLGYGRFRRNLLVALFSLGRRDMARAIAADDLPLVRDQARELGLAPLRTGPS
jgi:epoxyqueuosine reductase